MYHLIETIAADLTEYSAPEPMLNNHKTKIITAVLQNSKYQKSTFRKKETSSIHLITHLSFIQNRSHMNAIVNIKNAHITFVHPCLVKFDE